MCTAATSPLGLHGVYVVIVIIKFYIKESLEKIARLYAACPCVFVCLRKGFEINIGDKTCF